MAPGESSQPFFYVARSGQWQGPFSFRDIAYQVADRRIRAKDQMVVAGQQEPFKAGLLLAFPQLTPSYHDWLWCIKNNPQGVDSRGAALLFASLPVTLLATLFGLSLFPPGIYPKIVLAAPGILVGALFSYIYGFVVFRTPKIFGVVASVLFGSAGLYLLWQIVKHW